MYPQASIVRWNVPARSDMPPLKIYWSDGSNLKADAKTGARAGRISFPNYPPMLAEFEKKYDCDFREGFDGGTFYLGTKSVMHTGCYGQRPRMLPDQAQAAFPVPAQRIPRIKGSHFAHFFECCNAGTQTCAEFQYAAAITEFLLLGHLAIRARPGAKVEWDSQRRRCRHLPELNHCLGRIHRQGRGA